MQLPVVLPLPLAVSSTFRSKTSINSERRRPRRGDLTVAADSHCYFQFSLSLLVLSVITSECAGLSHAIIVSFHRLAGCSSDVWIILALDTDRWRATMSLFVIAETVECVEDMSNVTFL